ncbi:MAG: hypothetical protein IJ086_03725 [Clostridium sp.]|nr:hypothetical protein [Clostridium sp.]
MLKIFARVEGVGYLSKNGIKIMFYGTMTDGSEFNLTLPYTKEGILELNTPKTINTNKDITPQYFIDMGKVYEKVQKVTSDQVIELIDKVTEIKTKYTRMISTLQNDNYKLEKEFDECDNAICEYEKTLRRLRREDRKEELQQKINSILNDRDYFLKEMMKKEKDIDNLHDIMIEEIHNLKINF